MMRASHCVAIALLVAASVQALPALAIVEVSDSPAGDVVSDIVNALLYSLRKPEEQSNDDTIELSSALMQNLAPFLLEAGEDDVQPNASFPVNAPAFRFLSTLDDGEDTYDQYEVSLDPFSQNTQVRTAAGGRSLAEEGNATAASALDADVVATWAGLAHQLVAKWPIWVTNIELRKGSILGGGTCSFDFTSKLNFRFLPLWWKPTGVTCERVPKTTLPRSFNTYCVTFKLFQYVSFEHCAPAAYWQQLVAGNIISVNPNNGATRIDALMLLRTGGLDQFLPLRSALGSGGPLDILNFL